MSASVAFSQQPIEWHHISQGLQLHWSCDFCNLHTPGLHNLIQCIDFEWLDLTFKNKANENKTISKKTRTKTKNV